MRVQLSFDVRTASIVPLMPTKAALIEMPSGTLAFVIVVS